MLLSLIIPTNLELNHKWRRCLIGRNSKACLFCNTVAFCSWTTCRRWEYRALKPEWRLQTMDGRPLKVHLPLVVGPASNIYQVIHSLDQTDRLLMSSPKLFFLISIHNEKWKKCYFQCDSCDLDHLPLRDSSSVFPYEGSTGVGGQLRWKCLKYY